MAKKPINVNKYLWGNNILMAKFWIWSFLKHMYKPNKNSKVPCAISPNMTPNKNGNVMVVNNEGLAYLYLGVP